VKEWSRGSSGSGGLVEWASGSYLTYPTDLAYPTRRQYENVPKKADRLFGSLHFVPSAAPVKTC